MKAHIFKSKSAVDDSRKNVLSTVLLHIVKTMLPVYFAMYVVLLLTGPGKIALDTLIYNKFCPHGKKNTEG